MSVQFYIMRKVFSFSERVHLLYSFLLQKTLKSVFLTRYESLKLNHDKNYLMTSEDTFEDPLMSVHFCIKSNSFFSFRVTVHLLFSFLLQETLKSEFLPPYDSLKLNHGTTSLMNSEDTVEHPLMSVQFYLKSKVSSFRVTVHLQYSFLLQETLKSVILPPYGYLKLKNKTNYLMKSEDTFDDQLMSVHFYIKSNSFSISCYRPSIVFNFIAVDA